MTIEVLDPTQGPEPVDRTMAPRLGTLKGSVVGLYSNEKLNATALLDLVGEILVDAYGVESTIRGTYAISNLMDDGDWLKPDLCDFVVLSNGD